MKGKTKIFIVEDHPLMRRGITNLINDEPDLHVCGDADNGSSALNGVMKSDPDLLLVDISLNGNDGIDFIKNVRTFKPDLPVLVLSMHDETTYAQRALRAGAQGYIMKKDAADKVIQAVRKVLSGVIYLSEQAGTQILQQIMHGRTSSGATSPIDRLSDRELQVVYLIGRGQTTREIAKDLKVSVKTIEAHRAHIKDKLALENATELVKFCVQWAEEADSEKNCSPKSEPRNEFPVPG